MINTSLTVLLIILAILHDTTNLNLKAGILVVGVVAGLSFFISTLPQWELLVMDTTELFDQRTVLRLALLLLPFIFIGSLISFAWSDRDQSEYSRLRNTVVVTSLLLLFGGVFEGLLSRRDAKVLAEIYARY